MSTDPSRRRCRRFALAAFAALAATACAGHGTLDGLATDGVPGANADPTPTTKDDTIEAGAPEQADSPVVAEATPTSTFVAPVALEPQRGGKLVYGIEADTLNAWRPQSAAAAISGHMVMRSVYDLLAYPDENGEVRGVLLESFVPNENATMWTLETRQGITFHDGTAFDAEAVADNLLRHRGSVLTGAIMADLTDAVAVSPTTVEVTWNRPMPHFPSMLTTLLGYIASPTWLAAVDDGTASPTEPVGTGPFVYVDYEPGVSFRAVRNDSYWQPGLPYLDEVEFVISGSTSRRTDLLRTGQATAVHTDRADEIVRFREQLDRYGLIETAQFGETSYMMLNQSNPDAAVADIRVRRALAAAIDRDLYAAARAAGLFELANGPYPPGSIGHLEDTGAPTFDPELATTLIAEVEAERGPVEIEWKVSDDEFNLISAELVSSMWEAVGVDVTIVSVPQDQFIFQALTGSFDVILWRNHGGFDPDLQYHWWHSSTALPAPGLAVNFSRIRDDVIDQNLATIRESSDPEQRRRAAEAINRRFADQVYNIWLTWPVWAIAHDPSVHDVVEGIRLPDGDAALPTGVGIGGTHLLAQLWMEE